jgi:hypothetical protein
MPRGHGHGKYGGQPARGLVQLGQDLWVSDGNQTLSRGLCHVKCEGQPARGLVLLGQDLWVSDGNQCLGQ